ncbi:hypothetical protein [Kitasatospora sp. NPDC094015]|uniref:hypothetical protein n=1 Tax=Kitasatospora sp. NPDC094015 TaxID=3155205 RepID=UPI0033259C61
MTDSTDRLPLLFLDVDGPLIPFGPPPPEHPDGHPTYRTSHRAGASNPLLDRIDPRHGPRLAALPCAALWATTWEDEANECVAPRLGLPPLPVVHFPETLPEPFPEAIAPDGSGSGPGAPGWPPGLHWKTPVLVARAAGRPFAWVDDEISAADRAWVEVHHPGPALLLRVDPRRGLTRADYRVLDGWLRGAVTG